MIARLLEALLPPYPLPTVGQVVTGALVVFLWHGWYASIGERDRLYELAITRTDRLEECKVETGAALDAAEATMELYQTAVRSALGTMEIQP